MDAALTGIYNLRLRHPRFVVQYYKMLAEYGQTQL